MKRIIPFLIGLLLLPILSSCGESKAEKEARIKQERIEAENARKEQERIEAENARKEQERRERYEREAFETNLGTFSISACLKWAYNEGTRYYYAHGDNNLKENDFKRLFRITFGIPSDEKAKRVYEQAYEKFAEAINDYKTS